MVVHGPHMWVVMGGPEVQFGTRRGELEIGPKFWPPGHPSGPPGPPLPLPAHWIFNAFCSRFVKGKSGATRGGIMSLEGVKFSKKIKLRTDLFHHTHEVGGPCSYKNTPLRRRGPRVLESYCGFPLFGPHFSTLGHFHTTIRLQRQAPKTPKNSQKSVKSSHYGEKTREERAGHALSLVLYNQRDVN